MGEFYREIDRIKLIRALEKIGLKIWEGRKHTKAECIKNGKAETIPRHITIKNKEFDNIGKFLLSKYQREEIIKYL
jgi:hypothetical protein